ncbi:MAG: permease, partial [Myxococcales bacterium]|nr:permease [Myxococcales bacterium]
GSWGRTLDFVGAGFGLLLGAIGASGHGAEEHAVLFERLADFTYDTAPVLLLALVLAALVQANVSMLPPAAPAGASSAKGAALGVAHAVARPLATSGVLTLGRKLAHPAQMLGLMLAAPVVSIDFGLISLRFLGPGLTLATLGFVALLAWALGALVGGRQAASETPPDSGRVQLGIGADFVGRFQRAFEGLLDHLGIWMVLGLLSAAFVEAYVPSGALDLQHPLLALCVISAVALPSYLSAPSAVPVVAVAIAKGLPPGVAVAGLVLGATFNLRALGFFRARLGTARSIALALGIVAGCWGLAWGVGQGIPAVGEHTLSVVAPHAPGFFGKLATAILLLLLLRRVWFHGVRAWVAELMGSYAHEHHIAQASPREVS